MAAALLLGDASAAAAELVGRDGSPVPSREHQQQRHVWVGFTGEAPSQPGAAGEPQQQVQQQWPPGKKRSPSKFERLASGSPSPGRLLAPRKLIVTN